MHQLQKGKWKKFEAPDCSGLSLWDVQSLSARLAPVLAEDVAALSFSRAAFKKGHQVTDWSLVCTQRALGPATDSNGSTY